MSEGSERVKAFYRQTGGGRRVGFTAAHELEHRLPTRCPEEVHSPSSEISEDWEDAFSQAVEKFVYKLAERQEESTTRLEKLEQEVTSLKAKLAEGEHGIIAPVETFAPDPYELLREIKLLVLPDDMSFVATLVDASISASGETIPEAVANLKETMIDLFEILGKLPKSKIGKHPARQLAFLRTVMRKKRR